MFKRDENQMKTLFSLQTLFFVSRVLLGLVFMFSGFVKGIDPYGTAYKLSDYFGAFGMGIFSPMAIYFSFLLNTAEFLIGFALFAGYRIRVFSWLVLAFMAVFLPLTFFIAIFNPVADCGCFGDALIVSNWQTFWKNVVLMFLALVVIRYRKKYQSPLNPFSEWIGVGFVAVLFLVFSVYNVRNLPLMDFRPYHIGANFEQGMRVPEGAPQDEYETFFYYKNIETGKVKRFTSENYPWEDTLHWEFESYDTRLLKKGYSPSITNFSLQHDEKGDVTDEFVSNPAYSFLVVAYDLEKSDKQALQAMNQLFQLAANSDRYSFYATTASPGRVVERITDEWQLDYPFFVMDEITQKTIVRANPGVLFVSNGTIMGKWHYRNVPDVSFFESYPVSQNISTLTHTKYLYLSVMFVLGLLLFVLLYHQVTKHWLANKSKS